DALEEPVVRRPEVDPEPHERAVTPPPAQLPAAHRAAGLQAREDFRAVPRIGIEVLHVVVEDLGAGVVAQDTRKALVAIDDASARIVPQDAREVALEEQAIAPLDGFGGAAARFRDASELSALEDHCDQLTDGLEGVHLAVRELPPLVPPDDVERARH